MTENIIRDIIESVCAEICDNYCKYPEMPIPEGKDKDWLFQEGSPCEDCPLNKIN